MEHNPLISTEDDLVITYSDLKHNKNGHPFITIYAEQPTERSWGFNSAEFIYPDGYFTKIKGFTKEGIDLVYDFIERSATTALKFAIDDAKGTGDETPKQEALGVLNTLREEGAKNPMTEEEVADFVSQVRRERNKTAGILSKYANPKQINSERETFEGALLERHQTVQKKC